MLGFRFGRWQEIIISFVFHAHWLRMDIHIVYIAPESDVPCVDIIVT